MAAEPPVKVGDLLVVEPHEWRRNVATEQVQVVVTKAARVWIEMEEVGPVNRARTYRMRRDTQDSGNSNYPQYNDHFFTPADYEQRSRVRQADATLRGLGISFDSRSPFRGDDQFKLDLAAWLGTRED